MKLPGALAADAQGFADLAGGAGDLAPRLDAIDADTGVRTGRSRAQEEEMGTAVRRNVDVDRVRAEDRPVGPVLVVLRELRLDPSDDPLPIADLQGHAFEIGGHLMWRPLEETVHCNLLLDEIVVGLARALRLVALLPPVQPTQPPAIGRRHATPAVELGLDHLEFPENRVRDLVPGLA